MMINFFKRLLKDERGAESIEMALVVSTVAVATIGSYKAVTNSLDAGLGNITDGITDGTSSETP